MAKTVCNIIGDGISGTISLSQSSPSSPTVIDGIVNGLTPGKHGISINVFGDLTDGFRRCGPHFNPFGKQHGSPQSNNRHVGSLGNIMDSCVQIIGPYSVIGRSVVIYENEDDLGLGGTKESSINGNVGKAIAAGVIGIANISD